MSTGVELTVSFLDERHVFDRGHEGGVVFGRGAPLDIDSNPFLHRRVGRFVPTGDVWWLENLSAWTTLTMVADGTALLVPCQGRAPLLHRTCTVRFEAGPCNYELEVELSSTPALPPVPDDPLDPMTATYSPTPVLLSDEQRRLVVALAERRLREPSDLFRLPTNAAAAARLGWSTRKFNRKLDYLCTKLAANGVERLRTEGRRTHDRRLHLVDHMITTGVVSAADLELLDPPAGADAADDDEDGDE